jgi:hypothetical protein
MITLFFNKIRLYQIEVAMQNITRAFIYMQLLEVRIKLIIEIIGKLLRWSVVIDIINP